MSRGCFTLPGESSYEDLTLALAEKWGADVIRDSDGTSLSDRITRSGYKIYSTVCVIRGHNRWLKEHPYARQQTFLMSDPVCCAGGELFINLLSGYSREQFEINAGPGSRKLWQVFDRTTGEEISGWSFEEAEGRVRIANAEPWHRYTVNFLAWRNWEEISMYNHVTNGWNGEHLIPLDPRCPEAMEYLLDWMENWCRDNPGTDVVRFTSLFYNFVWIWGDSEKLRDRFTDWASYDFAVSPLALEKFREKYGYELCSEDFINRGHLHDTHTVPDRKKLDWMDFTAAFVAEAGKKLVDIVHRHGKLAYVFWDDSWIGLEPFGRYFHDIGFDGIIKCVFSGYEARMCAAADKSCTKELRLHPYLFPTGLGGAPTFAPGGDPAADAMRYWASVRRALMRRCVDRIGLGGYLHLTEPFPEFNDAIAHIADEFRYIRSLQGGGVVYTEKPVVGILTAWGKLRTWTCSGHYHEHPELELINILESLAGMPFEVKFLSFDDVRNGGLKGVDVLINAGTENSAWSGGKNWADPDVVAGVTGWVAEGGAFIGVGQPSMLRGGDENFRLAHILGVDQDTGEDSCRGRASVDMSMDESLGALPVMRANKGVYLADLNAKVLAEKNGTPTAVENSFFRGKALYLAGYRHDAESAAFLYRAIMSLTRSGKGSFRAGDCRVDCAFYPATETLLAANGSDMPLETTVITDSGSMSIALGPYELKAIKKCAGGNWKEI